jgi:hypothetical protein
MTGIPNDFVDIIGKHLNLPEQRKRGLPICLSSFPREILGTVETSPKKGWEIIWQSISERGCPFSTIKATEIDTEIASMLDDRVISPFDLPLILSANWGHRSSMSSA